jgi:hypothetical protein
VSLAQKFRDRDGKKLQTGALYKGYRPGIYQLVEARERISVVIKILSAREIPIQKPRRIEMDNKWLRGANGK